jgi:hypothetical protein
MPKTRTVKTANGGLHKYFQHPQDGRLYTNRVRLAGIPGADFRGDGGYVVLPPSSLYNRISYTCADPDSPIASAPDWLLEAVTNHHAEREEIPHQLRFAATPGDKWLQEALQKAAAGNRNSIGFQLAIQLRDNGLSEAEARTVLLRYASSVNQPPGTQPYTPQEEEEAQTGM